MEIINQIIQAIINDFDFSYCVVVNLLTYIIITALTKVCKGNIIRGVKRVILVISIIVIGIVYYAIGSNAKVLVNSAILAPISWSWIIKPILAKFGYDYKQIDNRLN